MAWCCILHLDPDATPCHHALLSTPDSRIINHYHIFIFACNWQTLLSRATYLYLILYNGVVEARVKKTQQWQLGRCWDLNWDLIWFDLLISTPTILITELPLLLCGPLPGYLFSIFVCTCLWYCLMDLVGSISQKLRDQWDNKDCWRFMVMNILFCFVFVLWCLASFIHRPLVFTLAWHESKNIDFFCVSQDPCIDGM